LVQKKLQEESRAKENTNAQSLLYNKENYPPFLLAYLQTLNQDSLDYETKE